MLERFSLLNYASSLTEEKDEAQPRDDKGTIEAEEQSEPLPDWFLGLTDKIRGLLTSPVGRTEEERTAYTDSLNRAVLGYEEDRHRILTLIQDWLAKRREQRPPPPGLRAETLAEAVYSELLGWSVLDSVLRNRDGLEEIQVVGERIYEVRRGCSTLSSYRFRSLKDLERLQQNLVLFNGDTLNVRKRWAEVMLLDGSRVTLTAGGFTSVPTLTVRFFRREVYDLDQLSHKDYGTLNGELASWLRLLLYSRFNLVLIGPTNSGKTTLMKALLKELPAPERLVTIEGRRELMLQRDFPGKNVIEYEVDEGDHSHNGAQAFKLALRQSPDRIIHAEIRDQDANLYVRACTRGHEGSMTTVHVNTLEDVPEAITDMCMMDNRGMDPGRLVRRVAEFVCHIGLELTLLKGQRKLVRLGEFETRGDQVVVRDWIRYSRSKQEWEYPLDISPKFANRMKAADPELYTMLMERRG